MIGDTDYQELKRSVLWFLERARRSIKYGDFKMAINQLCTARKLTEELGAHVDPVNSYLIPNDIKYLEEGLRLKLQDASRDDIKLLREKLQESIRQKKYSTPSMRRYWRTWRSVVEKVLKDRGRNAN